MSAAEACEKPNERVSRREACAPWPRRAELGTAGTLGRGGGAPPRGAWLARWEARPARPQPPVPGRGLWDSVGGGRVTGEPARAAALPST